ncbi:hypothetical protein AXK30_25780 [Escherichia coli]|nr:hypothetical protein AXK30_25780 [Escherichia coli]
MLLIACPLLTASIIMGDLQRRSFAIAFPRRGLGVRRPKPAKINGDSSAHPVFAMPVKQAFAPVLKLRKWLNPVSLVPGPGSAGGECVAVPPDGAC